MKSIHEDQKVTQEEGLADRKKPNWSINSSSGRIFLKCRLEKTSEIKDILVTSLNMRGDFWQRGKEKFNKEIVNDFSINLPQILIRLSSIKELSKMLENWMNNRTEFSQRISPEDYGDQYLEIYIGKNEGLIYSKEKPACVISYKFGSQIEGKLFFNVDQSCIKLCLEEINSFIEISKN